MINHTYVSSITRGQEAIRRSKWAMGCHFLNNFSSSSYLHPKKLASYITWRSTEWMLLFSMQRCSYAAMAISGWQQELLFPVEPSPTIRCRGRPSRAALEETEQINLGPEKFSPENPIMSLWGRQGDKGHFVLSNGATEQMRVMMGSLFILSAFTHWPNHCQPTPFVRGESMIKSLWKSLIKK